MNEERYESEAERLMAAGDAARGGTGTPITQREIEAVDALAQRNAMQHEVPVQKQRDAQHRRRQSLARAGHAGQRRPTRSSSRG